MSVGEVFGLFADASGARIADPSADERSTGFGILFHALARSVVVDCLLYP
ncbi:hypothetical protein SAMN05660766_2421 [Curtobacterium sp. 314Chir4.1]|nr:hypothetical protein SAMN05660766_2421 [Curtobacterium sp. 314Chir4.1]